MKKSKNYEYVKKIGSGNQGSVWKALNQDKKLVALKKINVSNVRKLNAAIKEIGLLKSISTPSCMPFISCYYDGFREGDYVYLEMEFIDGKNLTEYSQNFRDRRFYNILYRYLIAIGKDLLIGIKYLHDNGIIHRDIKPDNVIITPEHIPKLVDLGLGCKSYDCQLDYVDIKCCEGNVGTPLYMSPETLLQRKSYYLSDVWSFGVTLFNSATGEDIYNVKTIKGLVENMKNNEPKRLVTPNLLLDKVVNSAVIKDLVKRKDTDELLEMLKDDLI